MNPPRRRGSSLPALLLAVVCSVSAQDAPPPADPELEALRDRLAKSLPEVQREDIRRSGAGDLFELRVDHKFGYVTPDGRYLLSGDIVDLDTGDKITERRRNQERLHAIEPFADQFISFAPETEPVRWWITVFTDVDCHYCRQLHRQMPDLNKLGIGVRYLFFSKYGAPSEAYNQAQYIWCSPDRKAALDEGLREGAVKKIKLCKNPVVDQYLAAVAMNLRGTPVAILPDGSLFYGSAKADKILEALKERDSLAQAPKPPTVSP